MSSEETPSFAVAEDDSVRGVLFVVSAPSGAGKSTLVERVLARDSRLRYSVSHTTRGPRPNEKSRIDYHFVSHDEFLAMRDRGEFLEWAEVHGHLYATPKAPIESLLESGIDVILDIDVNGAKQVRELVSDSITIFILPPSSEVLEARLRVRNQNEDEDLHRRLRNAAAEVRLFEHFDYVVVNDDIERASGVLQCIIVAERHRPRRQRRLAHSIIATFGGESFHA